MNEFEKLREVNLQFVGLYCDEMRWFLGGGLRHAMLQWRLEAPEQCKVQEMEGSGGFALRILESSRCGFSFQLFGYNLLAVRIQAITF